MYFARWYSERRVAFARRTSLQSDNLGVPVWHMGHYIALHHDFALVHCTADCKQLTKLHYIFSLVCITAVVSIAAQEAAMLTDQST